MARRNFIEFPPEVVILDCFLHGPHPAARFPSRNPFGDSFPQIFRIGKELDLARLFERFERADRREQLHSIVRRGRLATADFLAARARRQHCRPTPRPRIAETSAVTMDGDFLHRPGTEVIFPAAENPKSARAVAGLDALASLDAWPGALMNTSTAARSTTAPAAWSRGGSGSPASKSRSCSNSAAIARRTLPGACCAFVIRARPRLRPNHRRCSSAAPRVRSPPPGRCAWSTFRSRTPTRCGKRAARRRST